MSSEPSAVQAMVSKWSPSLARMRHLHHIAREAAASITVS
jgi:hypothetical protein